MQKTRALFFYIVAAFRGMHVLPAKHSYCETTKKSVTTGQTDRQTPEQSDPYVLLCFAGNTKIQLSSFK